MHKKTVIELITDRALAKTNNLPFNDGATLCLAVEGGAMRGIISAGMLLALHDLKMFDLFDDFVGVSAGSLNLAYTLAGQGALGISVYFEDMTDKDIVNLLRFRSEEHPIFDMRKLYDHTTSDKQLDVIKLKAAYRHSLHVSVFNVTTNLGELVTIDSADIRFQEFLASGALLPFLAGDPWIIRGNQYYDGSLYYIDPTECAVEMNATHTFTLNTCTQDKPLKPLGKLIEKQIMRLDKDYPGAGSTYLQHIKNTCNVFNSLPYGETELDGMKLYRHALIKDIGVGRMTMDSEKLVRGLKDGYESIVSIFYPNGRVGIVPTLM